MALMKIISYFLSKLFRILIWSWTLMLSLPRCGTQKLLSLYTTADSSQRSASNSTLLDSKRPVYIPPEILAIILSYLPVKSLVRFKAVCRVWRFLIQSRFFVSLQLSRTIRQPPRFVLLKTSRNKLMLVDSEGCRIGEVPITEHWYHTIMGSYNGLLCVVGSDELSPFIVWNPMTGERIYLPMSDSDLPVLHRYADIGFDSSTKRYKVVRVYSDFLETNFTKFEIVTLGETSWRLLGTPFNILEMGKGASIYLDGFVYWVIATNYGTTWATVRILSLDIVDEKFQLAYLPHNETFPLCESMYINWNLLNLGGVLYLTALDQRWIGISEEEHGYQLMHAWQLMRNNAGGLNIRYLHTHKLYTHESLSYTFLLGMGKDDSFLFEASTGYKSVPKLVRYFTKSEDHLVLGKPGNCYWQGRGSFEPSLVSPRVALLGLQ